MTHKNTAHVPSLDGVRAIAALMVMFFHFFQNLTPNNSITSFLKTLASFGQTGVSLFFVLSGFLITRILIREKNSTYFFRNFYLRRTLRIFPLYYLYLILVFIIIPLFNHQHPPDLSKQIYHWVYLQDFAITFNWDFVGPVHFWSLAVEEHFYLFFPLIVYYLKENHLLYAIVAILLSSLIVRFIMNKNGYEVFYFTFSRLDELSLGAILAVLEAKNKITQQVAHRFIYLFIIIALPTMLLWLVYSKQANESIQVTKYLLISLSYFCIIGFIISAPNSNFVKKSLQFKPLVYIGKISYGLYVYHGLCFHYLASVYRGNSIVVLFIGSFLFAIIISSMSFYVFESFFFRYKDYYKNKHTIQNS